MHAMAVSCFVLIIIFALNRMVLVSMRIDTVMTQRIMFHFFLITRVFRLLISHLKFSFAFWEEIVIVMRQMSLVRTAAKVFEADKSQLAADVDVDSALVECVQTGDVAAFDELVRKYRTRLYSVLYNLTGNREDASDLTQDAFIKAFQSIGKFRGKSAFYTWLYRIAVNNALSFIKKNRRRRFFSFDNMTEEAGADEIFEAIASKTRTEKAVLMDELQERLNESLQKLSEKHRTVVVLHEIEGLSHAEIADITRTSIGTVRSRLHYAKSQLQADLQPYLV